jgi:ankyrin repeat protein
MDLRYPIIAGNVAMVKFCLENGSDASAPLRASVNDDHQGWQNQFILTQASPLLTAIMSQSSGPAQKAQLIHLLLKHGAKPEWLDSTLSLAFPYAVVDGDVQGMTEFVEALMNLYKRCGSSKTLELHSDVLNSLALFSHVLNDDATSIETRLGAYHFSNTVRYRVNQDQYGTTLLYVAARFRKYKAASKLLYMGADPFRLSQCNAVGTLPAKLSSPALTAILQGDLVMLELLLSNVRPESEALVVPSDDYLDDILLLVAYEEDLSFSKRHAIAESYGGRVSKPRNKHRLSSQVHLSATQKQILDIIVRAVGISRVERIKRWDVCLREEIASYKLQALPKVVSKVYQKEAISRPLAVEAPKSYLEILTAEMGSLIGNNSSADRKVDESP